MSSSPKIDNILHTSNGESVIEFTYNGISVKKHSDIDIFNLASVEHSIQRLLHKPSLKIQQFLKSLSFYNQLCNVDSDIQKYGNVYLMINMDTHTFKVGRTYNYALRYTEEKKKELVKCIPVLHDASVESELLREYKKTFSNVGSSKETFSFTTKKQVIDIFDAIAIPKQVDINYKTSKLINQLWQSNEYHGLWVSKEVCQIIFNNYLEDTAQRTDCRNLFRYIDMYLVKDLYIKREYNEEMKTYCVYWKYHKYTLVMNENTPYVNGSRLWNSIQNIEGKKTKTKFNRFLQLREVQRLIPQFKELHPDLELYTKPIINKKQPQFSGTYVHYILVHTIVNYLDAEYAILVAELMFQYLKPPQISISIPKSLRGGDISDKDKEEITQRYLKLRKDINSIRMLYDIFNVKST